MLPQTVIDTLIIFAMFVLRIGVPIVLTLAFGYWLEKKLAPPQEASVHQATGARIIQFPRQAATRPTAVHCWDLKECSVDQRSNCAACQRPDLPCWLALQAQGEKLREACFTCALYTQPHYRVAV